MWSLPNVISVSPAIVLVAATTIAATTVTATAVVVGTTVVGHCNLMKSFDFGGLGIRGGLMSLLQHKVLSPGIVRTRGLLINYYGTL